jgi:SAM-dependent methyltransferase
MSTADQGVQPGTGIRRVARRLPLSPQAKLRLRRLARPAWFGTLHRTSPLSHAFGFDRGRPVNRYYIDGFLKEHRADIHGAVLEVEDAGYTNRFGSGVTRSEVLDVNPDNPHATIIADLASADAIASESFDCFISTQVYTLIYDIHAAIEHSRRILRPGGVLLVTVASLARGCPTYGSTDYWRLTANSCQRLFGEVFGLENVEVRSYGNVLTACATLMGLACEDLSARDIEVNDPFYPVIIAVRAVKR